MEAEAEAEAASLSVGVSASSSATAQAVWSQVFLFAMTLGLSATVEFRELRHRVSQADYKYKIACGVGLQYLVMPVAGWLAVVLLQAHPDFTPAMGITLLVLTSSPGGAYSTWWVAQWNADLALSVAMTTVSSFLGVVLLPLNVLITTKLAYSTTDDDTNASVLEIIEFGTLLQSLIVVIAAIFAGIMLGYIGGERIPKFTTWMNRLGNASGLCLVGLGLAMGNQNDNSQVQVTESIQHSSSWQILTQPWPLYAAVAIPFIIGLALPHWICRRCMQLSKPETVAIAIECCYQNK